MTFKFECPQCGQPISATSVDIGIEACCPTCNGPFTVPNPGAGQDGAPQPPPISRPIVASTSAEAMFLYIPTSRLAAMSIVSPGLYNAYWIYRNWRYIKERDGLKIQPFWRGMFGIFYIHSLLKAIKTDPVTSHIAPANFSPGRLATGWIVLGLLGSAFISFVESGYDELAGMLFGLIIYTPIFCFLLPVQDHIKALNEASAARPAYYRFSGGHITCLVLGIIMWLLIFAALFG